ncbi:MAG: hypothetical protein WCI05_09550 [Myxococcales bacterium]
MIVLLSVVLAFVVAGTTLDGALWSLGSKEPDYQPPTLLERVFSSGVLALALAVGWANALAVLGAFRFFPFVLSSLGTVTALVLWRRRQWRMACTRNLSPPPGLLWLAPAVLVFVVYVSFALVRGHAFFVLNHDGLAYHMPIAQIIRQTGALVTTTGHDIRLTWPANYEILLAATTLLSGTDKYTAWVGTASFVALLLAVGAVAQRFWGGTLRPVVPMLITAAMPVVLLHSSAHKNDLMMGALFIALAFYLTRWVWAGGTPSLVLTLVSAGLLLGTKLSGFFLGPACAVAAVFGFVRLFRRGALPRGTARGVVALGALFGATLLGPVNYVWNWWHFGRAVLYTIDGGTYPWWGDFDNVWMFAYLAMVRPFSSDTTWIYVPWSRETWFWPDNDFFMSTFGAAVSVLALVLPIVVLVERKARIPGRLERALLLGILVSFAVAVLAIRYSHEGFFNCSVRYTVSSAAVVVAWSAGGALALIGTTRMGVWIERGAVLGASLLFAWNGYDLAHRDGSGNLDALVETLQHPEYERRVWGFPGRAGSTVDLIAGPHDHVLFDGAFDSWVYPAYGRELTRKVTLLRRTGEAPTTLPDDVDWVVTDRAWAIWFGHPKFRTMGDWHKYIGAGRATAEDIALVKQLKVDPRFRLVYYLPKFNQAVFQRVSNAPPLRIETEQGRP